MKTVFNSDMCAHVWAQRKQDMGRNSTRSMSFAGRVAYSYRTPVANIVRDVDGRDVALFTSNSYSVTTSGKHMPAWHRAWSGPRFTVPFLLAQNYAPDIPREHAANMRHFEAAYKKLTAELMRVPCDSWRVSNCHPESADSVHGPTRAHSALYAAYAEACRYAAAFGLDIPAWDWKAAADAAIARRDRLANDPKRAHKRELAAKARERAEARAEEARAEQRRIAALEGRERVARWLAGADVRLHCSDVDHHVTGDLLRVRGDKIETSRGAECPLSDAVPALAFWRRVVDSGQSLDDTGIRLGHFRLGAITESGDVRAGCHTIKRATLEALERTLAGVQS